MPPLAHVHDQLQVLIGVGELPLVDNQTGVDLLALVLSGDGRLDNLVKRHFDVFEVRLQAHSERQVRRGQCAGNGDHAIAKVGDFPSLSRHEHRSVAISHAGSAVAQHVLVVQVRIGMEADRCQFQFATERSAIQCFDVDHLVLEAKAACIQFALCQGIKHKCIVRVWAVTDSNQRGPRIAQDRPFIRWLCGGLSHYRHRVSA